MLTFLSESVQKIDDFYLVQVYLLLKIVNNKCVLFINKHHAYEVYIVYDHHQ